MSGLVLGIGGLVVSGITAGVSFAQSAKAKAKAKDADRQAQIYLDKARKNVVDRYASLGISKQPYKQESDALIAAGAQLTEAAAEGDQRGVGATAGKIQGVQTQAQAGVRNKMTEDIQALEQVKAAGATEADKRTEAIELGMANQQFQDSNAYNTEARQAFQSGVNAAGQAVISGIGGVQAYGKGKNARATRRLEKQLGGERGSTAKIKERFSEMYQDPTKYAAAYDIIKTKGGNSPQFNKAWDEVGKGTYTGDFDTFLGSHFTAEDLEQMASTF